MKCSRCNIPHASDYQLVSTEQGLLCPACVRVVEAVKQYPYGQPPILMDEQGPIIDPLYNPYETVQTYAPKRDFMREAFEQAAKEWSRPIVDADRPTGISQVLMSRLTMFGVEDALKRTLEETGRLRIKPQVPWNEEDNG